MRNQAVRGLKWQAVEIAGRQLLALVVFTTLARLLDPASFGLVAMVGVYLAFVAMFVDQGLSTALIQRKELEPEHVHTAFWCTNIAGLFLFGLSQVLAPWVARLMAEPQLVPLIRWASVALLLGSLTSVQHALFARELDFRRPAMRTLLANLTGGGVGISLALGGYGVWALVFQQITAAAVGAAFIWAVSSYRPRFVFSITHLRQMIAVSAAVFGTNLLWFISSRADHFFIGKSLGAGALGMYNVAGRVPEMARMAVIQPVAGISQPALSRLQHDHTRMVQAIIQGMEAVAFVAIPVFVGLVAVAPSLVVVMFGQKWIEAVPILQLLAVYQLVFGLGVFCHPALLASNSPRQYLGFNVACAVGAVAACVVGSQFGSAFVVMGLIVNLSLVLAMELLFLKRRIGLPLQDYVRPCLVPAALSMVMATSVWAVARSVGDSLPAHVSLMLQIITGGSVYVIGCLVIHPPGFVALQSMAARRFAASRSI